MKLTQVDLCTSMWCIEVVTIQKDPYVDVSSNIFPCKPTIYLNKNAVKNP